MTIPRGKHEDVAFDDGAPSQVDPDAAEVPDNVKNSHPAIPAGSYTLCAIIDPDGLVPELNEDDNTVYSDHLFVVLPDPHPDNSSAVDCP